MEPHSGAGGPQPDTATPDTVSASGELQPDTVPPDTASATRGPQPDTATPDTASAAATVTSPPTAAELPPPPAVDPRQGGTAPAQPQQQEQQPPSTQQQQQQPPSTQQQQRQHPPSTQQGGHQGHGQAAHSGGGEQRPMNSREVDGGEGDDEGEVVVEEPRLKYLRLGGDVPSLLSRCTATAFQASDKLLTLGTSRGTVHVLDYDGNEVRQFQHHGGPVTDISFDEEVEWLASCSEDGSVVVRSLYGEEVYTYSYKKAIRSVAIDPRYGARKTQEFVCGGLAGQLTLSTKGWLGSKTSVLHSGEGPIPIVRWAGSLVAWANDLGVKVYDMAAHCRVAYVERPPESLLQRDCPGRCGLYWQQDALLYIGWGATVQVMRVVSGGVGVAGGGGGGAAGLQAASSSSLSYSPVAQTMATVAKLQLGRAANVQGLAPFGHHIAVLTTPGPGSSPEQQQQQSGPGSAAGGGGGGEADLAQQQQQQQLMLPQLRIVTWRGDEVSTDALPLANGSGSSGEDGGGGGGCESPAQLSLHAYHPFQHPAVTTADWRPPSDLSASAKFREWWRERDEPLYFVVSNQEVVLARPRDATDRVMWLLDHKRYQAALEAAESDRSVQAAVVDRVSDEYLHHLMNTKQYHKAAGLCPRLLKGNAPAWERWVYLFAQLRQLPVLTPYLPTGAPSSTTTTATTAATAATTFNNSSVRGSSCTRLRRTAYEMALTSLLPDPADHAVLLATLRCWPPDLYSLPSMTDLVLQRMRAPGGDSLPLLHCAAHLYGCQGRYDMALTIHLRLRDPAAFDFIQQHRLLAALHSHIPQLLDIDSDRATRLLVDHWEQVQPALVVPEILACSQRAQSAGDEERCGVWRLRLHHYLDALFQADSSAAGEYHVMQVELYAQYDPPKLMSFLQGSQRYSLERALATCEARGLVPEQVYILGRMGAASRALQLIVGQLGDVQQAVEFVVGQGGDEELWEALLDQTEGDAELTGQLLDQVGGYIDPLRVVRRLPPGLQVQRLRDRLVAIIADYRTQTSLREGCNAILKHDCVSLQQRLYRDVQHALRTLFVGEVKPGLRRCERRGVSGGAAGAPLPSPAAPQLQWWCYSSSEGRLRIVDVTELPGPLGARSLHIRPKAMALGGGAAYDQEQRQAEEELPKAWVGIAPATTSGHLSLADDAAAAQQASADGTRPRRAAAIRRRAKQQQQQQAAAGVSADGRPPLAPLVAVAPSRD